MSYLHAEKARYHDPHNPEDSEEENPVHCSTVFPAIFLCVEKEYSMALIQPQLIIYEKSLGLGRLKRLVYLSVENQIWTAFFTVKKWKKKVNWTRKIILLS